MGGVGAWAYFGFIGLLLGAISLYALWRTTQRPATSYDETAPYMAVAPQATAVAMEVAQEVAIDQMVAEAEQSDAEGAFDEDEEDDRA